MADVRFGVCDRCGHEQRRDEMSRFEDETLCARCGQEQTLKEEKEKMAKLNLVAWEGAKKHNYSSAKRAHAHYLRLARAGLPSSIYLDGECAGTSNGEGSQVDSDAGDSLAELL